MSDNDFERVEETGYASFEDLEHAMTIKRTVKWCPECQRKSMWRDHIPGQPTDRLMCLGHLTEQLRSEG